MDIRIWNRETRQAFVGTLTYSILGILSAILTPIFVVGTIAGHGTFSGLLLAIVEICIICGYFIFFLAIKDLKKITDEPEKSEFNKIYISIIFDILCAIFGIFHMSVISGICGIVSCVLLVWAYSSLKSSKHLSEISESAVSGFSLLFTAEILVLVAIFLGMIPVIKVIGAILKAVAWILVILGWMKVSKHVNVPGEQPAEDKPVLDTVKEVIEESMDEAKEVAKEAAQKTKIVAEEIEKKAKEAEKNIKERLEEKDEKAGE